MRKVMVLLLSCLLLGCAQAEELHAVDVVVTEGATEEISLSEGESAALDAMCLQDFDGDGVAEMWEMNERFACSWRCEDAAVTLEERSGFTQWHSQAGTGFGYPAASIVCVPASADGTRICCELTDKVTGEKATIQYTLHLDGMIARDPVIHPAPVCLGGNSWEVQVEEGTEVSIQLNDALRAEWDGEASWQWQKTYRKPQSGWAESATLENDGPTFAFTAELADNGWSYEWFLSSQDRTTGEYVGHAGQLLMYVYPKGEKPALTPVLASGVCLYESGKVIHSVYGELSENDALPHSVKAAWRERLILNHSEGLSFAWSSDDAGLQALLDHQRGVGQHLVIEPDEQEANRLIESRVPLQCTIRDQESGETLAVLTYTIARP